MFSKRIFNVFNSYFRVNGVTLLANENMTSTSIARAVQEAIVRNGIGNKVWSKLEYDAELTVEMQTNVMSFEQIAMACGSAIVSGATKDFTMAKAYDVVSDKITLDPLPTSEAVIEIVDLDTDEVVEDTKYTIVSGEITFSGTPKPKRVKALPYETLVADAKVINIASDKFSEAGELILKTYAVDENAKITDEVTIHIPKAKPSSNFTIATSSEISNGNDNTTTVVALDDNGSFGRVILTPVK